jgi:hypothetical protein
VIKCRLALEQESRDLKAALDDYAERHPVTEGPYDADLSALKQADSRLRDSQRDLLSWAHYQARLTFVNAHDHLASMARLLGSDGAMSLYAHTTMSRSVCEAAVRLAWLLDPSISYEERITRSAAMVYYGALNKLKGARQALARPSDASLRDLLVGKVEAEFSQTRELINKAGMDLGLDSREKEVARIEFRSSGIKVPVTFKTGTHMERLLGDSPGWYLLSSAVSHSAPWVLDSAVIGGRGGPELSLTPDLMEIAAASQTAISASALLIDRHATYYGFDPAVYMRKSSQRRGIIDALMREQVMSQVTNPAALVPASVAGRHAVKRS